MISLDRWIERLQRRDAVCAAILSLAEAVKTSIIHRPEQFEEDLSDRLVNDARVQLAQLIEDPALALAVAHALQILCRRWEEESHVSAQYARATLAVPTSIPFLETGEVSVRCHRGEGEQLQVSLLDFPGGGHLLPRKRTRRVCLHVFEARLAHLLRRLVGR